MTSLADELRQAAGVASTPGDCQDDTMGNPVVAVEADGWSRVAARARTVGARLDWLRGVDGGDPVKVAAIYVRGDEWVIVQASVGRGQDFPSVSGTFASAAWHERATCQAFGVRFTAGPGDRAASPDGAATPPLLLEAPLCARRDTPWPGAGAKRRAATPGVRPEWFGLDDSGVSR